MIDTEIAVINQDPFACIWFQREDRTPQLVLEANLHYWNKARGPRLEKVIFLNDIEQKEAIDLVCTLTGEVDIVTNVSPSDAARIVNSPHAKLIKKDAMRVVAGIFNRTDDLIDDIRIRQALNLAIDRQNLVETGLKGYGEPSAGLTPSWTKGYLSSLRTYDHDQKKAKQLLAESDWKPNRRLRLVTANEHENLAQLVAIDLRETLEINVDLIVFSDAEKTSELRKLAEKQLPLDWDVFIYGWSGQTADAPPLELHCHFVGKHGALRAGRPVTVFDDLYDKFTEQTDLAKQMAMAHELDKLIYDQALALFMCSPQALYAVNNAVDFTAYATTFELAECSVSDEHWSVLKK